MFSTLPTPPWPLRYGSIVLALSLATLLRSLLEPVLGQAAPFQFYYVALIFITWYAGIRPALVALPMAAVLGSTIFLDAQGMFSTEPIAALTLFAITGLLLIGLTHALRKQRANLAAVLSSITEAYFVLDRNFRFVTINPEALRSVFRRDDASGLIGRRLWEVFPESKGSVFYEQYHRAMREQREVHFEGKSNVAKAWLETHVYPRNGRLEIYIRDISDRKETEEALAASEKEFRAMFELDGSGKSQADAETGRFVRVNRRFCEITGYTEAELLQLSSPDITHPDDVAKDRSIHERMRRGELRRWQLEKRLLRKDGDTRWVLVSGSTLFREDGRPYRAVATMQDITERIRAEQALREADRRKDEFLAMLAHELRNPLAPIVNALQLMRMSADDPAVIDAAMDIAQRQTQQLVRLVDDLLDIARITRGKIELRRGWTTLEAVLRAALEIGRAEIETARHELSVQAPEEPVAIFGDETRLAQALANLLVNAARYTPKGGHIELAARCDEETIRLEVSDDGEGIDPAMAGEIFELFQQAQDGGRSTRRGLGVGLFLVKSLVELHGGSVTAESAGAGRGSRFTISLPRPQLGTLPTEAEPQLPAPPPPVGRRILVVDDNEDVSASTAMLLRTFGHQVETAHNGTEALERARTYRPDIALLDLGMPDMDGCELAVALHRLPETRHTVLIAVTGWGQEADQRRTQEAGFSWHLVKPVQPDKLQTLLQEIGASGIRAEEAN